MDANNLTMDDLRDISKNVDTEMIYRSTMEDVYKVLNIHYQGWTVIRGPIHISPFYILFIWRPRQDYP